MLRIGMDDLFQKAFPEHIPYPDPAQSSVTDIPRSYDDRTALLAVAVPGKTPQTNIDLRPGTGAYASGRLRHYDSLVQQNSAKFLDLVKPEFLPQYTQSYIEPSGRVWDFKLNAICLTISNLLQRI